MGQDLIRWNPNERVGIPDMDAMSDLAIVEQARKNVSVLLPEDEGSRIFSGFHITDYTPSSATATLHYGEAIMSIQKDGQTFAGFLLGLQSPTSYVLDFGSAGDDDYNVYVRPVYSDGEYENRAFWSPSGSAEYIDYVATRRVLTWEAMYQSTAASAPSSEWMLVWEIEVTSNLITAVADKRHFFFEGDKGASWAHEWGDGGTDRSSTRETYGLNKFHSVLQAIRRQLADIIGEPVGTNAWYSEPDIELISLGQEHISYADNATHYGKHHYVNFGSHATPYFWKLAAISAKAFSLEGQNQADTALITWEFDDSSGNSYHLIEPRGTGANLTDGDSFALYIGKKSSADWQESWFRTSATDLEKQWGCLGTAYLKLNVGSANAQQGLEMTTAGYNYYVINASRTMMLPLDTFRGASGSNWYLKGPAGADVTAAGASGHVYLECAATSLSDEIFIELRDFPEGATLTGIQVCWYQSALGGGVEMQMYAARHLQASGLQTDGDVSAGNEWTTQALHSVTSYITYAKNVTLSNVLTFTPNQNNDNWTKEDHKLVLGFISADAGTATMRIYSIRTYWTYRSINPWPIAAA
jgi:hypothetical protein